MSSQGLCVWLWKPMKKSYNPNIFSGLLAHKKAVMERKFIKKQESKTLILKNSSTVIQTEHPPLTQKILIFICLKTPNVLLKKPFSPPIATDIAMSEQSTYFQVLFKLKIPELTPFLRK